jgi:hypothetical protein
VQLRTQRAHTINQWWSEDRAVFVGSEEKFKRRAIFSDFVYIVTQLWRERRLKKTMCIVCRCAGGFRSSFCCGFCRSLLLIQVVRQRDARYRALQIDTPNC